MQRREQRLLEEERCAKERVEQALEERKNLKVAQMKLMRDRRQAGRWAWVRASEGRGPEGGRPAVGPEGGGRLRSSVGLEGGGRPGCGP